MNMERILVVESDPDISDFIARQALQPLGYQVTVAPDAPAAIRNAVQSTPDLILVDLALPGLSGKDLLAALSSQGIGAPIIILASKEKETDVIQAFRLGAADYLRIPARDAEVVTVVERVLKQTREARAREQLDRQLKQTNQELQRRVRELTTIFTIGRAVISITDQRVLFEKIVEGAVQVSEADMGWFQVRDDKTRSFLLAAQRNLPDVWARKVGQPLDDGVGKLVAVSGETLAINGQAIGQFKVAHFGKSAVVVPVKAQNEVIGLMTMLRKADKPFEKNEQSMLEALADYASISMVNAQLFKALAQTAEAAQAGEKRKYDRILLIRQETQTLLQSAIYPMELLLSGKMGEIPSDQRMALETIKAAIDRITVLMNQQQPTQPR